jgi:hypothetical protein
MNMNLIVEAVTWIVCIHLFCADLLDVKTYEADNFNFRLQISKAAERGLQE